MRVLILSPHYPPDVAATGQLVAELAEDLAAAGYQPVVLASRPSYLDQSAGGGYRLLQKELRNGVEIHWLGVPRTGRRGVWSRLLPFAGYFMAAGFRALFLRKVDIVFAQSTPPLLAGVLARVLAWLPGRRFVYNLQDVYPELGQALGVLGEGPVTSVSRRIERGLRRRADRVVVIGDDMRRRVQASDPTLDNIEVIGNWADTSAIVPLERENRFRTEHGLNGRFVVMYSGNLGRAHGVEILPDVAARLAGLDDLVLVIVGEGPARSEVEQQVRQRGLKNVRFLPYQDKENLAESLSAADVALILQRRSATGLVVPSKLYGILASGRPAVAAVPTDGEVARVLRNEEAGLVTEPEQAQGIADAVSELYLNRPRAIQMGQKARQAAVNRHDRSQATGRYIQLFKQLLAS